MERTHAEELRLDQTPQRPAGGQRDGCARADHDQGIANDEPHRRGPRGTERQPQSDLLRPLRDDERHHAIQADNGQDRRDRAEATGQRRKHPFLLQCAHDPVVEGRQAAKRHRADLRHRCTNRGKGGCRLSLDLHVEGAVAGQRPGLLEGEEGVFRAGIVAQRAPAEVGDDADDLDRSAGNGDTIADRTACAEITPGEALVHDDRAHAGVLESDGVGLLELAAGKQPDSQRREEAWPDTQDRHVGFDRAAAGLDRHCSPRPRRPEQRVVRHGGAFDARRLAQRPQQIAHHLRRLRRGIAGTRRIGAEHQQPAAVESALSGL
jgi:hypothetical protein